MTVTTVGHTPGPWHVQYGMIYVGENAPRGIAEVDRDNAEEGEANARLIAAAPDLLAALAHVADVIQCGGFVGPALLHEAEAAIARARGVEVAS